MDLDLFAEYFTTHATLTALVYDNRCLGASDGLPRGEIIPHLQQSDLQDAITFAQSLEEVDSEKIAIWGTSYSGGHVLQVGAVDRRVKAVLAQGFLVSGLETFKRMTRATELVQLEKIFAADRAARMKGEEPATIPVVSSDPAVPASIPDPAAFDYMMGRHQNAPSWCNQVTIKRLSFLNHTLNRKVSTQGCHSIRGLLYHLLRPPPCF